MEMNNDQENITDSLMLDRRGEQKKGNIYCAGGVISAESSGFDNQ